MIIVYVGGMGSGKSLSMVKEAYNYYKQGYKILSNMKLNFTYTPITSKDIQDFAKHQKGLYDTVILLDEVHIFIDSRRSASGKNLMTSYFITQTRKQKVKLLCTTQHRHQLDRRLRDNVNVYVDCEKHELPLQDNDGNNMLLMINYVNTRKRQDKISFIGNKYFGLYDTEEIIMDITNED